MAALRIRMIYRLPFADVAVFPNPATTSITLQFDLLKARNVSIAILNSSGQKVYAEELKHVSGRINQLIDIKEYVSGAYYLQLVTDDAIISKKILKQ